MQRAKDTYFIVVMLVLESFMVIGGDWQNF